MNGFFCPLVNMIVSVRSVALETVRHMKVVSDELELLSDKPHTLMSEYLAQVEEEVSVEWTTINDSAACEDNLEDIARISYSSGISLSTCKHQCLAMDKCKAVDFYSDGGWCNFYDQACSTPLRVVDRASSYSTSRIRNETKPKYSTVDCKVYTWYEDTGIDGTAAFIDLWNYSWSSQGWRTQVLSRKDAERHPKFEELLGAYRQLPNQYNNFDDGDRTDRYGVGCYLRWVAMSQTPSGGFLVDYDVLNAGFSPDVFCKTPPAEGELMLFDNTVPSITAGSRETYGAWAEKMARVHEWKDGFLLSRKAGADLPVSDMGLVTYFTYLASQYESPRSLQHRLFPEKTVCNLGQLCSKGTCDKVVGEFCIAVHMSHADFGGLGIMNRLPGDVSWAASSLKESCLPGMSTPTRHTDERPLRCH